MNYKAQITRITSTKQNALVQIPALPDTSQVTLGKPLNKRLRALLLSFSSVDYKYYQLCQLCRVVGMIK